MNNVSAAYQELKMVSKKRPTIQQKFTIFRFKKLIEDFLKSDNE